MLSKDFSLVMSYTSMMPCKVYRRKITEQPTIIRSLLPTYPHIDGLRGARVNDGSHDSAASCELWHSNTQG